MSVGTITIKKVDFQSSEGHTHSDTTILNKLYTTKKIYITIEFALCSMQTGEYNIM